MLLTLPNGVRSPRLVSDRTWLKATWGRKEWGDRNFGVRGCGRGTGNHKNIERVRNKENSFIHKQQTFSVLLQISFTEYGDEERW